MLLPPTTLVILNSQNLGANPTTRPQGTMSISMTCLITPAQMLAIIDLTMEAAHEVKSSDYLEQDKWVV